MANRTRERPTPSETNYWESVWRLLLELRSHFGMMSFTTLIGMLHQGSAIASAAVAAYCVGAAATGASLAALTPAFWLLAVLVGVRALAAWGEMWLLHDIAYRILAELRSKLYWALERLAPSYLLERRSGDVAAAAMADVDMLEWFYAHTVGAFVIAVVVPLAALGALAWMHPLLPLALLPAMVMVALVPYLFGRLASAQGRVLRAQLGALNAEVVDSVQGLREVVSFGQEEWQRAKLLRHGDQLADAQLRYGRRAGIEKATSNAFTAIGMLSVLATSAWLVAEGALVASLFPVSIILAAYSFGPIVEISHIAGRLGVIMASAARVFDILQARPAVEDREEASLPPPLEAHIRYESVSFRYAADLPNVLHEVSFEVRPGETVALVGASGAGKSTCAQLLLRFWDVTSGAITLGGYDLRDLPQQTLREHIALVPQDIYLFNDTLGENIRLANPQASEAAVEEAARAALAHDFIAQLPQGYDTNAGERGLQLSGGQRQRIAIARAFLKDAPILVMDEAVSNLDTENERALQTAMARLHAGRTTLVIAHRLSTIRAADKIVVLDAGRVAEVGTHQDLLEQQGVYASLVFAQNKGVIGL